MAMVVLAEAGALPDFVVARAEAAEAVVTVVAQAATTHPLPTHHLVVARAALIPAAL